MEPTCGARITLISAPSAFVRRTTCGGEARCQAYTWVKPGIQEPRGHCWLKHTLPNIVKDRCCNSAPRRLISKRDLQAEDKINRPGSDFKNFNADSWRTCEEACAEDGICASWTYVHRGGARSNRPLLVEKPSRATGLGREHGLRSKIEAGVRADRLGQ